MKVSHGKKILVNEDGTNDLLYPGFGRRKEANDLLGRRAELSGTQHDAGRHKAGG
jgi:hypothetical protein